MEQNQAKIENSVSLNVASDKRQPVHFSVYEEYVRWSAMPSAEQKRFGIETQKQFAEYYKISERTINRWNGLAEYRARVRDIRDKWAFGRTSNVVNAIYASAMKGSTGSQVLWMQLFEDFEPKAKTSENKQPKVEVSINDVRFMIEQLPEKNRQRYYGFLRDLFTDIDSVKVAREVDLKDADGDIYEQLRGAINNEAKKTEPIHVASL